MKEFKNSVWINPVIMSDRIDGGFYRIEDIELLNKIYKSNMSVKSLIDISEDIKDGPHDGYTFVDEGVLFIRSQNIKDAGFNLSDKKYITKEFHDKFKKSWLEVGNLLITRIGEYYGNATVVSTEYVGCNINHAIAKIKLKDEFNPYYLCAYVNSSIGNKIYRRLGKSFTSPRVNLGDYSDFFIPIPSPEIQKYIGDKVRKAEELREEAKRLKKEAEDILSDEINRIPIEEKGEIKSQWINFNMIDDRIDGDFYSLEYEILEKIDEFYDCISLEKLILEKFTGKTPTKSDDLKNGIPLLLIKNMEENLINKEDIERKIRDSKELKKTKQGDMLITRVGNGVGVTAIIEEDDVGIFISDNIIDLSIEDKIPKRYISFYLNSKYGKLMIERWNKGAVQPVINYQSINKFKIPVLEKNKMDRIDQCIVSWKDKNKLSKKLINEAKQDIENLIEGNLDRSKIKEINQD